MLNRGSFGITALVGQSGSLLERFHDVTEGQILVDGRDIRRLNPRWLHRHIAIVPQEPMLFTGRFGTILFLENVIPRKMR